MGQPLFKLLWKSLNYPENWDITGREDHRNFNVTHKINRNVWRVSKSEYVCVYIEEYDRVYPFSKLAARLIEWKMRRLYNFKIKQEIEQRKEDIVKRMLGIDK